MRSDAFIIVSCEACRSDLEIQLTALSRNAWDERDVKERLRREGWDPEREICDGCLEAEEEGA
jgi:hypothetical protein